MCLGWLVIYPLALPGFCVDLRVTPTKAIQWIEVSATEVSSQMEKNLMGRHTFTSDVHFTGCVRFARMSSSQDMLDARSQAIEDALMASMVHAENVCNEDERAEEITDEDDGDFDQEHCEGKLKASGRLPSRAIKVSDAVKDEITSIALLWKVCLWPLLCGMWHELQIDPPSILPTEVNTWPISLLVPNPMHCCRQSMGGLAVCQRYPVALACSWLQKGQSVNG